MNSLTVEQEQLLKILLSKYEQSKTCSGDNKVTQHFKCKPIEVYADYNSDYLDVDLKTKYDIEISELEKSGYITIEKKNGDIVSIVMKNEMYNEYCRILGMTSRTDSLSLQRSVFEKYISHDCLIEKICIDQLKRLGMNKENSISKDISELQKILDCIIFIVDNKNEILERELSIAVFSDSKVFENKYKSKVCNLLLKYGNTPDDLLYGDDKKESYDMLLSNHNIVKNPTYIYFKGNGVISFRNGYSITLVPEIPVALNSQTITDLSNVSILDSNIMSVENLTSYNRLKGKDTFLIYLSGYSNKAKNNLLQLIHSFNINKNWYHFGDIDPDGFHILENLRRQTGIDFQPHRMGIPDLIEFNGYTKCLEPNDINKAKSLKGSRYSDVINYMIDNNCKLEQEIISWKSNDVSRLAGIKSPANTQIITLETSDVE